MRRAVSLLCALQAQQGRREASALAQPSRASSPGLADVFESQVAPALLEPREDPHLSYVAGGRHAPILNQNIGAALEQSAAALGEHEAVVAPLQGAARRLSYRELLRQADEVARGLLALGVQRRDRVGVWAPNSAEWVVLQYAAARCGAILVNLNPALKAAELAYALNRAGVSVLVMAPELRGACQLSELERIRGDTPQLRHKVCLGPDAPESMLSWGDLRWIGSGGAGGGLAGELRQRQRYLRPSEPANIQFTSGTTGFPKAATLSHRGILNNALQVGATLGYTPADRVCIPVPLFHCFGSVMGSLAAMVHGATAVYPSECFDAGATLAAAAAERCTSLYGVPTMFISLLEHPEFRRHDLRSLRTGIMAGAPCPREVMLRVQQDMFLKEITICYGQTELSPVCTQTAVDDPVDQRVGSVGRVHPHLEAKVVDPATGHTLPRGQVGELCVRGYSVMLGYWGDPAATSAAIDEDRWMHTGDLALLDGAGYCSIVGRIKDMVIRGGENIYPREVEEFLHRHPAVAEVQVFGVPDPRFGEAVCAWVRLREGHRGVAAEELRAWLKGRLASFKVPAHWKFVDAFPATASGKPQKFKMAQQAALELGLAPARAA